MVASCMGFHRTQSGCPRGASDALPSQCVRRFALWLTKSRIVPVPIVGIGKIANVSAIPGEFVRKKPPSYAEFMAIGKVSQDSKLNAVADVAAVSVLHFRAAILLCLAGFA